MIRKIRITKAEKTVPKDAKLELGHMTVITGENNSGKTNFIKEILGKNVKFIDENNEPINNLEIVYIAAENIKPSENELKYSAVTSNLITNLVKLFSNLGFKFKLDNKENTLNVFNEIKEKANKNLENFSGHKKHKILINLNEEDLDSKVIIKELIDSIIVNEYINEKTNENRKLEDLGQGTQRLIVASILKAYLDILIEKGINTGKPILILFEEPEIYLHPRLKRTLNETLEKISIQDNHQVIITTHDSYFVFPNFDSKNKVIVSFVKEDGFTVFPPKNTVIDGIEDELLFIFLYSRLSSEEIKSIKINSISGKRKYMRNITDKKTGVVIEKKDDLPCLDYIRHQIHHSGDNPHTYRCGITKEDEIDMVRKSMKNFYSQSELSEAIRKMSEKIGARVASI